MALVVTSACDRTTAHPPPPPDTTATDGSTPKPPPAPSCGFTSAALSFELPVVPAAPAGAFQQTSGQGACSTAGRSFTFHLRDMDGDLRPDLVVDGACDDATVGTSAWLVYLNTGTGFAQPVRYALPVLPSPPSCTVDALVDVNGDLKPDIVVTSLCTDPSVGTSRWLVYLNGPGGFTGSAQPFALPTGFAAATFATLEVDAPTCSNASQPAYSFFDLTGDAKPDLVVTAACDDLSVGTTAWRLYAGSGTGVAPSPVLFALPTSPAPGQGAFATPMNGDIACAGGRASPRYALVDFDGDLKPDLMVTKSCFDPTIGATQWSFYRNGGSSFAASPASVALPILAAAPPTAFDTFAATVSCSGSAHKLTFATFDANGDLRPDLVLTGTCDDPSVGVSHWVLLPNTKTGFGPAEPYVLPEATLGATLAAPAGWTGALSCSGGASTSAFVTGYLVPPSLDLIVTATCHDPTVGASRWLLFSGACPG